MVWTCPCCDFDYEDGEVCPYASTIQPGSSTTNGQTEIEEEKDPQKMTVEELRSYFFANVWDYSHLDERIEKHPHKASKEERRLKTYRKFAQDGPYQLNYAHTNRMGQESDSLPSDQSPHPPDFRKMGKTQLAEFCARLGIYVNDIPNDLKNLKARLEQFKVEAKEGVDLLSLESANEEYHKHLAELRSIAVDLNDLQFPANAFGNREIRSHIDDCRNLVKKLPTEKPSIFVFGDTSSGKSTFLNLLLEDEILPTGVDTGLTTAVCQLIGVRDKSMARIEAIRKNRQFSDPIYLDTEDISSSQIRIRKFTAEDNKEDPQYEKVDLLWPCKLLNSGISLLDSPGLNDARLRDDIHQWWIEKVQDHVKESVATICIITPPNVSDTVSTCLHELVKTQRNNKVYNGNSLFFVITHLDTEPVHANQLRIEENIKNTLRAIVPDCPLDKNVVPVNLVAAINARRWGLYSPEHVRLMRRLEDFFKTTYRLYLTIGWKELYKPVHRIYEDIHDHYHIKTGDRKKIEQDLRRQKNKLLKFAPAYNKAKKEYGKKTAQCLRNICAEIRKVIKEQEKEILETVAKADLSQVEISETSMEEGKVEELTPQQTELLQCIELTKMIVKSKIFENVDLLEFVKLESTKILHFAFHYSENLRKEVEELQNELQPDFIEPLEHSLKDVFGALTDKDKIIIASGVSAAAASAWIALGVIPNVIAPGLGVALAAVCIAVHIGYITYKSRKKMKWIRERNETLQKKFGDILHDEELYKLLENFYFVTKPADDLWNKVNEQIKEVEERVENLVNLLADPNKCQEEQDLEEMKWKMDSIQNSLQSFRFQTLKDPELPYQDYDVVKILQSGPIGDKNKVYDVKHCVKKGRRAQQPGAEDLKEANPGDGVISLRHLIVKTYKTGAENSSLEFAKDRVFFRGLGHHKNLAKCYGFTRNPEGELQLVSEYVSEGSLSDWITNNCDVMTHSEYATIAIGICRGMAEISRCKKAHGNLRPENIMVASEGDRIIVKVGRHYTNNNWDKNLNALRYQAPEIIFNKKIDKQLPLEMYSFGLILWEMWYNEKPYGGTLKNLEDFLAQVADGVKPKFDKTIPPKIKAICEICWRNREDNEKKDNVFELWDWEHILQELYIVYKHSSVLK